MNFEDQKFDSWEEKNQINDWQNNEGVTVATIDNQNDNQDVLDREEGFENEVWVQLIEKNPQVALFITHELAEKQLENLKNQNNKMDVSLQEEIKIKSTNQEKVIFPIMSASELKSEAKKQLEQIKDLLVVDILDFFSSDNKSTTKEQDDWDREQLIVLVKTVVEEIYRVRDQKKDFYRSLNFIRDTSELVYLMFVELNRHHEEKNENDPLVFDYLSDEEKTKFQKVVENSIVVYRLQNKVD